MDSDYGVARELSPLQKQRLQYQPELPPCLQGTAVKVEFCGATTTGDSSSDDIVSRSFPHTYGQPLAHLVSATDKAPSSGAPLRVGIVFSGRPSAGGHNIVWGLYDALKTHNPKNTLLGFLRGTEGLFAQKTLEITQDVLATYRNQGGFDMLGRAKDQIRTAEQVKSSMATCKALKLDGLVIVGGVKSNTDAAYLAETFAEQKLGTKVIGVPATINGDLKNKFVEADVGFNTICKVNSQLISNLCTDALSAEKYYFFVRVMGRKASHVALECALRSNPNMLIIGEEVATSKLTLFDITKEISDAIRARNAQGKNHGVILIPEGLAESIPELYALLHEIHSLQKQGVSSDKIAAQLTPWASALFQFLPPFFKKQLLIPPESDEESPQSQIEMEKLLAYLVEADINKRLKEGTYKGKKLAPICHFFGYQTRGSLPLKFDCDYAYTLGQICYHILATGLNGYMATATNLKGPVSEWHCGAAPLTAMMTVKRRSKAPGVGSTAKPMIHPTPVDLKGMAYEVVKKNAESLLMDDIYTNPGPIQYDGVGSNAKAITLCLEDQDYIGGMSQLEGYLNKVESMVKPGCSQDVLKAALCSMESVKKVLSVLTNPSFSS